MADLYYSVLSYNIINQAYSLRHGKQSDVTINLIVKAFDSDRSIDGLWF
jgi:hypothetical protein